MAGDGRSDIEADKRRLVRVLGLPEDAPVAEIRPAGARLLASLRRRRDAQETPDPALVQEITALERALARHAVPRRNVTRAAKHDRTQLAALLLGAGAMLVFLFFYAGDLSRSSDESERVAPRRIAPAQLVFSGPLDGATLRVLDADRVQVLVERPAADAVLELRRGRYALEVGREDCPDRWTRSVFFEAGQTYRFEPSICGGEGTLTIRSNVEDDRLVLDGVAAGSTGPERRTLSVGDHQLRIEKEGYRPYETRVRIRPDEHLEVQANLAPERPTTNAARRRALGLDLATQGLTKAELPKPEPFDLGGLQEAIAPGRDARQDTRLLERDGLGRLPDGGSTAWHDRVSREFLARFDTDRSGRIDQLEESESISCAYWRETETSFERGGLGLSMARYYGFDGTEWHRDALGFSKAIRAAAYARMRECGLQA